MLKSGKQYWKTAMEGQKPKIYDETKPFQVNKDHNNVQLQFLNYLLLVHPDTEGVFHMMIPNL